MAVNAKFTEFSWNEADVAGTAYDIAIGFVPTFMVLWISGRTETTDAVGRRALTLSTGFAVSDSNRRAVAFRSIDASGTANLNIRHTQVAVLTRPGTGGADEGALDLEAAGSWTDANTPRFLVDTQLGSGAGNYRVFVLAIGGDVSEANTFHFQEPGATGAQAVAHGLSDTPTGAILMSVGFATTPAAGTVAQGMYTIGASDGTRNVVLFLGGDDGANVMDTRSYCISGECIALGPEPAITLDARASVTSFDATNINLDWTERASTRYVFGLAWRGGEFRVDNVLTATDTTNFGETGYGFQPSAAMFLSAARAESTADTPTNHAHFSIGAATSASERGAHAGLDEDGVGTSEVSAAIEHDAVYVNISTASAVQGLMDLVSFDSDGMTLVMADADPSQSFVGVLAWGADAVVGGTTAPPFLPGMFRPQMYSRKRVF